VSEPLDAEARSLLFKRSCKVLAHEIGHIFGIHHCIYHQCLMNGSNHLQESDAKPIYYCPIDLRKLHISLKFDVLERQRELVVLFNEFGWTEEEVWGKRRISNLENYSENDVTRLD